MTIKTIPKPLKIVLCAIGIVLAVYIYAFWGSKLENDNKDARTPEMYGLDSLEYQAEPVMEIRVWQRNEKEYEDYPERNVNNPIFYNIVPLSLKSGVSVETKTTATQFYNLEDVIEVVYDGNMTGHYDIAARNMVHYGGTTDNFYELDRTNDDGTFSGNRKMMLRVGNTYEFSLLQASLDPYDSTISDTSQGRAQAEISRIETSRGINYKDYYHFEYFFDIYPDTPEVQAEYGNLRKSKRLVLTNYLTIQAMHPTKPEVPVATAVLEITRYSDWFGTKLTPEEIRYGFTRCDLNHYTSTVTVVSYEQSDALSMG